VPPIPPDILHPQKYDGRALLPAKVGDNPFVFIGLGLTVFALCGMIRSSIKGNRVGVQKFMRFVHLFAATIIYILELNVDGDSIRVYIRGKYLTNVNLECVYYAKVLLLH
jgi:hypothetical protein